MKRKSVWTSYNKKQITLCQEFNEKYKEFLNQGKTERECIAYSVAKAKEAGFKDLREIVKEKKKLKPGDKVYAVQMNKTMVLFQIGEKDLEEGMAILGAHVDSPRMDVKQNPVYEAGGLAYFDTHYYGGIKKYQWVTLPLAIHGVFVKKDGTVVKVELGEKEDDPVFCVTDLLIHLSGERMQKKANVVVEGENLDLLVGNIPDSKKGDQDKEDPKDTIKANVLRILKETYQVEEEDFLSAELEIVPAGKARDLGVDRSMVIAYGHDDKVCAYTSLMAMLDVASKKIPAYTTCCLLVDKEEIGSVGATGMQSRFFENMVAELIQSTGKKSVDLSLRRCLANSRMLSSDVSAGYDPLYQDVFDQANAAFLGKGMVFNKYTGARGKSGSNDANAEYVAKIRNILDEDKVVYQTAELGKVDAGGGGTIAYITALYGMEVIDCGVAVLNMHAPWEIVSKADVYETYRGYLTFLEKI